MNLDNYFINREDKTEWMNLRNLLMHLRLVEQFKEEPNIIRIDVRYFFKELVCRIMQS